MHDCQIQPPYCDPKSGGEVDPNSGNCGEKEIAPILFVICMLVINYMLLNLLIAVILDNFMETQSMSESKITDEHFESFDEAWAMYDFNGDGFIESNLVPALIVQVLHPLGLKNVPLQHLHGITIRKHAKSMSAGLNCQIVRGMVAFASLRTALNAHAMGDIELPEASDMVQDFKRRHSRKAGAGAVNKIKRFSTRKGILKRKHSTQKNILPRSEDSSNPETEDEKDIPPSTFDDKRYTMKHVVAVVSAQAVTRGNHTRKIIRNWKQLARRAHVDDTLHPNVRSKQLLAARNFDILTSGVSSIHSKRTLSKLAEGARLRIAKQKMIESLSVSKQKADEKERKRQAKKAWGQ
tara:strand:+ start:97 stop:1149 length:1053 start_codon:yes stop_codon:yes gene_type:complete